MGTVCTRYSYTCCTHDRPYTANSTSALRQSKGYRRPPLPPLGLRWVLPCAHRACGLGPREGLPAKRKRKRARAGQPMAARGAGSGRRCKEDVARAPLGSLRWRRAGSCRCTKPAKGVRKHGASATGHGHEDQDQERPPGRPSRGHRGRDCREQGRWAEGSRRGHARRERPRGGRSSGPPPVELQVEVVRENPGQLPSELPLSLCLMQRPPQPAP